jgi:hypothetical protein
MAGGGGTNCADTEVIVDGRPARAVLAEFEGAADTPLAELFERVDPAHWTDYGGGLFKTVTAIGPSAKDPWAPANLADHGPWRRTYLEVAELGIEQLTNVLAFDATRTDTCIAFTFDLAHSVDGGVEVDRGYFLVTDQGGRRRVKALKIIRLADRPGSDFSRVLINEACPLWGLWIKTIVAAAPIAGDPAASDPTAQLDAGGAAQLLAAVYRHRALDFANRSMRVYGDYAADVGSQLMSGSYDASHAIRDGLRLSWHVSQDLIRIGGSAWGVLEAIEAETRPNAARRGRMGLHPVEHVTWPLPRAGKIEAQDLTSIAPGGTVLPKNRIVVVPTTHDRGPAARVAIDTTNVPYGMYVGSLVVDGNAVPFQFYVSQAVPAA